jgi:hypothetical protein
MNGNSLDRKITNYQKHIFYTSFEVLFFSWNFQEKRGYFLFSRYTVLVTFSKGRICKKSNVSLKKIRLFLWSKKVAFLIRPFCIRPFSFRLFWHTQIQHVWFGLFCLPPFSRTQKQSIAYRKFNRSRISANHEKGFSFWL